MSAPDMLDAILRLLAFDVATEELPPTGQRHAERARSVTIHLTRATSTGSVGVSCPQRNIAEMHGATAEIAIKQLYSDLQRRSQVAVEVSRERLRKLGIDPDAEADVPDPARDSDPPGFA